MQAIAAVRGTHPGSFAVVMATGIVSAALRDVNRPHASAALLVIAAAGFAVLAGSSGLRAAAFPADVRHDLTCPARAFTGFAFVAACGVLGDRLAEDHRAAAASVLAVAALAAWLALTWLVPGRMAARHREPPAISDVSGNWYLWVVGTQSLAIAAAFVSAGGAHPGAAGPDGLRVDRRRPAIISRYDKSWCTSGKLRGWSIEMKRYKFQALVTLGSDRDSALGALGGGQMRRVVIRGQHHDTGTSRFFTALVTKNGWDRPWPEEDPVIMTVALVGDDPVEYFEPGDHFAFWLGHDLGQGVVTRRLFV